MASIPCNIVLLPSSELAQKLIETSRNFSAQNTLFTLDGVQFYPHVSLYMTQLKTDDIPAVQQHLADIAQATPIFDVTAVRYDQATGYLDAEYQRTEQLDHLQTTVVDAINPIRDGLREKDKARLLEATGIARENLEKYGYRNVNELFRPHATITRFAGEGTADITKLPEPANFNGQFTRIGLFEMGDNGTCIREIASYALV